MKKLLSLLLAAVMMLSLFAVSATAANGPMPTNPDAWGGARIGFSQFDAPVNIYIVNDKGSGLEINNDAFAGATYDKATNTLTLEDVKAANYSLFLWYMGDDFKLAVEGDCEVGIIYVSGQFGFYNTNLHITGTGSLTINRNKESEAAIFMFCDGDSSEQKLIVDDSVTLHLYASDEGKLIINNYGTNTAAADAAISVGGKGIDGVTGERIMRTEYDEVNLIIVSDPDEEMEEGFIAKSKSDPDGVYSVTFNYWGDSDTCYVKHYVYLESIGLWAADPYFGEYDEQKIYTREAFDREFTIAQSEQLLKVRVTDDDREANKGIEVVQLKKTGEPDEIYGGRALWRDASDDEDPDVYLIYHLFWDEAQGIYVQDEEYPYTEIDTVDLADNGFSVVTTTETRQKEMEVWANPAPFDDDNMQISGKVYQSKYNSEQLFIERGTFSTETNGVLTDRGVILQQIYYDEENDAYYIMGDKDRQRVSTMNSHYDRLDVLYDKVFEEVTEDVKIRYINSDYGFDDYSSENILTAKAGEDTLYGTRIYHYDSGDTEYSVMPIELRDNGHYYGVKWEPDDEGYYVRNYSPEEFAAEGYSFMTGEQDAPFTHMGEVEFRTYNKYSDAQGNAYGVEWDDTVYAYSEDAASATFGGVTYYLGELTDLTEDMLISSAREIPTDTYHYTLKGSEYHHEGTGVPPAVLLGDADGDGQVTILDATAIQRNLVKLPTEAFNEKAADADENGKIEILDATAIQRWLVKLSTHEGIGEKYV